MIPLRIQLAGFLCYREPQEACFDGRTLWMLAGPNGSGKSALFDAVTFALFGQHRGGRQNARGLIHHECDSLVIEFDFVLDDKSYRARRTLSRQGRSTRQMLMYRESDKPESETWATVPDTHTERGFARWIDSNIALTYETFTASVLLLQGRADNLLLATPAQRHRLLCHVAGLDLIERLAQRAQQHLSQSEGAEKACRQQVKQLAPDQQPTAKDLRRRLVSAEQQWAQQFAQIDQLSGACEQAVRWQSLTSELAELQEKIDRQAEQLEQLHHRESKQRSDAALVTHLAALRHLFENTLRTEQCHDQIERLETSQGAVKIQLQNFDATLQQTEQSIAAVRRQLSDAMDREKRLTQQQAQQTLACSTAGRFSQARERLRQLRARQATLHNRLQHARQQHAALQKTAPATKQLESAHQTVQSLVEQTTRHEMLSDHLRQQLQRLRSVSVSGERCCPYCQQPLAPEHCGQHERRLERQLAEIETQLEQTRHQAGEAAEHQRSLQESCDRHRARLESLSQQVQQAAAQLKAERIVEQELIEQCRSAYDEMPADVQATLGNQPPQDWTATAYPDRDGLSAMRQQVCDTTTALQQLAPLSRSLHNTLEQSIARQASVTLARQAAARTWDECREQLAQQRGALSGHLALQTSARSTVPHQWRDLRAADLSDLIRSIKSQCSQNLPAADNHTNTDTQRLVEQQHVLQARRDLLTEELAKIPPVAHTNPAPLKTQLNDAREQLEQSEAHRVQLRSDLMQAQQRAESHRMALERLQTAGQHCRLWKRLARLLGRDGLQRVLLETTERAIVQYANTILDRLTGGRLYVELARPTTHRARGDKVLDLVARTTDPHAPVQDVAFLSGSQKFRVAVALSLAIGQFASNTRHPAQAVIIDEGFGCLDTTNRQVMIQELQNLKGHLQRILLVSHQDEFVSAFPDGYRCELVDGATQLTPFHA